MRSAAPAAEPPNIFTAITESLTFPNQYLKFIFLDLFWKSVWLIVTGSVTVLAATWMISAIGSTPLQGPELDTSNPILWIAIVNLLWRTYSSMVFGVFLAIAITSALLWLSLEALFRGGRKHFRVYFASGAARTGVLTAIAVLFVILMSQDGSAGVAFLAAVILLSAWLVVAMIETVVRRDSVQLIATDLGTLVALMACLLGVELFAAVTLWGLVAALMLMSSSGVELLAAMMVAGAVLIVWTVLHSFLLAVRFSTIDIMRRNVVDG